jgi:hypothetical protein
MSDITPKHFDRANPCTKVDLHNCFYRAGKYVPRRVIEARSDIGLNAPKYLLREGYATETTVGNADFYILTEEGKAWLSKGIRRYLELHPEAVLDCREPPVGFHPPSARKPAQKPAKQVQTRGVVVRRIRPR